MFTKKTFNKCTLQRACNQLHRFSACPSSWASLRSFCSGSKQSTNFQGNLDKH